VKFGFIRQQMKAYPITVLCAVMEVSRSGFYDYLNRLNTDNPNDEYQNALTARIKAIFNESKGSYGSRRVLKKLQSEGHQLGRYKVRRLMRDLGLRPKRRRRYKLTTDSRHSYPVAANVLDRKFDVAEANRVWAADITYVWTLEGWLYLAAVMELFSRQIVGWAMDKRMKSKLTLDALAMAYWRRKPPKGLLHHSDRGSQYACYEYQKQLQHYGMIASMCRKVKSERLASCRFATRKAAETEILDYITYYNFARLHSTLRFQSAMQYEKEQLLKVA
jgi:transposase InsO family protein